MEPIDSCVIEPPKVITTSQILRKYTTKRIQTDLRRQRKWREKVNFICQHCGLVSSITGLKVSPTKHNYASQSVQEAVSSAVVCSALESKNCDISNNDRSKQTKTALTDNVSSSKSSTGVDLFSEDEPKQYLCGKCHYGFDHVDHLVEHVASCRGAHEGSPMVDEIKDLSKSESVTSVKENLFKTEDSEAGMQTKTAGRKVKGANLKSKKNISKNVDEVRIVDINKDKTEVVRTRSGRQAGYLKIRKDVENDGSIGERTFNKRKKNIVKKGKDIEMKAALKVSQQCELQEANGLNAKSFLKVKVETIAPITGLSQTIIATDTKTDNNNLETDENTKRREIEPNVESKEQHNPNNKCSICSKTFAQKSSLSRHQNLVHRGVKKYECETCHKRYQQKHNLTLHKCLGQKTPVSLSLLCIMCGKSFSSVSSLRHHEKTLHAETKQFKCPTCSQAFSTAGNMREHLKAVHNGRAYLCDLCGRSFSFKNSYNRHQRYHTGVKPYKCQHCERTFSSREGCQAHVMTHIVTEKVQCEYCGKRMKNLLCVSYHMKTHHGCDESRGFQCYRCKMKHDSNVSLAQHMEECQKNQHVCQCCFKTFSCKSNLTQHLKTHTMMEHQHV